MTTECRNRAEASDCRPGYDRSEIAHSPKQLFVRLRLQVSVVHSSHIVTSRKATFDASHRVVFAYMGGPAGLSS